MLKIGNVVILAISIILIVGIVAIMNELNTASEEEEMKDAQKVKQLKIQYENNPTFVNQYAWYDAMDSYQFWHEDNYDSDQAESLLIEYVQNYSGENGGEDTIIDVIWITASVAGDIGHPSTYMSWYVLGSTINQGRLIDDTQTVVFSYESYDEKSRAEFWVNVKTGNITFGNELAKDILKIVDAF